MGFFDKDKSEKIALSVGADLTGVPTHIQLLPGGEVTPEGKKAFKADTDGRKAVIANFAKRKNDMVVDYEHQTLKGTEAPAAGWITGLEDRGDGPEGGIWAKVSWTARAVEYLKGREYRYLSPVVMVDEATRRVTELVNAALTNAPAIDGMIPIVNKEGAEEQPEEELAQEGQGELEEFKRKMAAQEVGNVIQEAMRAGKITPAMRPWAEDLASKDIEALKSFIQVAPVLISTKEFAAGRLPDTGPVMGSTQQEVNKHFGISAESFKKYANRAE
jgi:phage I-like protein